MSKPRMPKTIFEYDDYRQFLRDYYHFSKETNKNFSYRYFARLGGFKSGNILKIVMDGDINIVDETIFKFCKALKLNHEESQFFRNLVYFNQAKSSDQRQIYSLELLKSKTYKRIHPLSEHQYKYFECWYFPVIRGLVSLTDFKEDFEWMAQKLNPPITPTEAKKAVESLLELGLLSRSENGRLIQTDPTVTSVDSIVSSSLALYHKEMMKKAAASIDLIERDKRELSALTLGVSLESVKVIKEMIIEFRKEILDVALRDPGLNQIYQLNIHLFPITHGSDRGENS